jgi:hypothetical protein
MSSTYRISTIKPNQLDSAYLLVREVAPALGLQAWRAMCRAAMQRNGDGRVLIVTNPLGYIQGLCVSAVRNDTLGSFLDVPILVVASAADELGVAEALIEHLANEARLGACHSLRIWTLGQDNIGRLCEGMDVEWWDHGVTIPLRQDMPLQRGRSQQRYLH